jgi:hypothetical protein
MDFDSDDSIKSLIDPNQQTIEELQNSLNNYEK